MICTEKIDRKALVDAVVSVQLKTGRLLDVLVILDVMQHTIRKAELNGKDESYVPVLFENELRDHLMREEIGRKWGANRCVALAG